MCVKSEFQVEYHYNNVRVLEEKGKITQNLIKLLNYMVPSEEYPENLGRQGQMSSFWKVTEQADKTYFRQQKSSGHRFSP
jgi:hypothetical protein